MSQLNSWVLHFWFFVTDAMPDFVHYALHDRVAVLTIDNPPVNALGQGVWEAIDEAVARAATGPGSRALAAL